MSTGGAVTVEVISATRLSQSEFFAKSALAASLKRLLPSPQIAHLPRAVNYIAMIAFENRQPLAEVYNSRIRAPDEDAILLFVHDDVWIEDVFLGQRLKDALSNYDVVGLAGNRRPSKGITTWGQDERSKLSGSVAHGSSPMGSVVYYGETPAECELLDGVFLAARRSVLRARDVLFDPRFQFHFYDLDFCRTARQKGLRLGTWPISITHQSTGPRGEAWQAQSRLYLDKWKDAG